MTRLILLCLSLVVLLSPAAAAAGPRELQALGAEIAAWGDRSGPDGLTAAAASIRQAFEAAGAARVGEQRFSAPLLEAGAVRLHTDSGLGLDLALLRYNAISPGATPPDGLAGPLVYVGRGRLDDLDGLPVDGAIVVMDMDSGRAREQAAALGAAAIVFVDHGGADRGMFLEKEELSPIDLPCAYTTWKAFASLFPELRPGVPAQMARRAVFTSQAAWTLAARRNVYALFPGTDPELGQELLVVEAFYDSSAWVAGHAPAADESLSLAALLDLAAWLGRNPQPRSVLLVATDGHAQGLAGMREFVWAIGVKGKELKALKRDLEKERARRLAWCALVRAAMSGDEAALCDLELCKALDRPVKLSVDAISTTLFRMRMAEEGRDAEAIREQASRRMLLRRLGWRTDYRDLPPDEAALLAELLPRALEEHEAAARELKGQLKMLKSSKKLRSLVRDHRIAAVVSLHLSSHGTGLGAFERGFHYALRERVNRTRRYKRLHKCLRKAAGDAGLDFVSLLRPDRLRPWRDLLPDRPGLGGEVAALAGYPGFSLVTMNDARGLWGTPADLPGAVDWDFAARQQALVQDLVAAMGREAKLKTKRYKSGFAVLSCRASLLLHGELFADQPAPGATILAFQGPARLYAAGDLRGHFMLKGVADKKHVYDKVIIEGYRFDEHGRVRWAIDKKQTGKSAYRVKVRRRSARSDLVMFEAVQTTIFNLLEPRTFNYMTKLQLIDARREAPPRRYWYSRIDTRASTICSIFLEPGSRLKLTLSDTVLKKKMILTGADGEHARGLGYPVDSVDRIPATGFRAAVDMWALLGPRIDNLERHAIHDQRIRELHEQGLQALEAARAALAQRHYGRFREQAQRSWALASQVYDHVEQVQKDVLWGVLFYIALFVPFAFCMERLLFGFVSIYKRILGFSGILLALITVIYNAHPAFELAYSPTVVILAFFIIGLSFMVSLIIFLRFEREMQHLQRRASAQGAEISPWKAAMAAFFLGVNNLRRRRMRTALTCLTLVILTFTIMSFTSVKSIRRQGKVLFMDQAPYHGLLLKRMNWTDLPPEALATFRAAFAGRLLSPRVWLETESRVRVPHVPVELDGQRAVVGGLAGFGPDEPYVSGMDRILVAGAWFGDGGEDSALISTTLAREFGLEPEEAVGRTLTIFGMPHRISGVFSGGRMAAFRDLDGEQPTPVIFPDEQTAEMSEVEQEALESGEDVRAFQSRYRHVDPDRIVFVPARRLLRMGGGLKSVAVGPGEASAAGVSERFGLAVFSGGPEGCLLSNAGNGVSYSGLPNIAVPLLLSVLIVLNTMIGAVFERKREIAVYTSVGLAPSHVSFLFVAEALAFGVISVVLGYLLAQGSAALLAGTSLWAGITVNYSSMAGVAAMLLVMAVVLVSVIHPSRTASRIAIPDVNRSWRLPEPRGDTLELTLPFLLRPEERERLLDFLHRFLADHSQLSHGAFSTGEVRLAGTGPEARIQARVWLAPFDFGIMQDLELGLERSAEDPQYYEVHLRITRLSGELGLWQRILRRFIHALRKQLLLWRSLSGENGAGALRSAAGQGLPGGGTDQAAPDSGPGHAPPGGRP